MHTFAKLPVIKPIKIQMYASKYVTKSRDKIRYVELVVKTKFMIQSQKTGESEDPLEDPLNL